MWLGALSALLMLALSSFSTTSASTSSSSSSSSSEGSLNRVVLPILNTKSGLRPWVDIDTPANGQKFTNSRGQTWELVMSDEFSNTNRSFKPGEDPIWTSLEKPDGVNGALELYSHNMSSVVCDNSDGNGTESVCYLQIKVIDEVNNLSIYNMYTRPPAYQNSSFFYRSAMLQSWNKFCFQGGMLEVRLQLPGVTNSSVNPDMGKGDNVRAETNKYYPTWPGVWLMGNLGRAIFSASTYRMWPFSYSECNEDAFNSIKNQRISACNATPGSGLNPYQGRGAPEIDLLEGGGVAISSSIQIGPGMPPDFRRIKVNVSLEPDYNSACFYSAYCTTPGSNFPNVPTALYEKRNHTTWYKGLRYAANNFCTSSVNDTQTYSEIKASYDAGLTSNTCTLETCSLSHDVQGSLDYIDGVRSNGRWGINSNGTCFPAMNAYQGGYLCDPDNQDPSCATPRNDSTPKTNTMEPFNYQMDALSANWGIHTGAYTSFLKYQLEWVTGEEGYIRWMLEGHPIFEIPAEAILDIGEDATRSNPNKVFPEEPMYIILNVALSQQWGAFPPNPGYPCRGDGTDKDVNAICDSFPMYMKIDYVRLYQDVSNSSSMAIGCDPNSHPTRQFIIDNLGDYTDDDNTHEDVNGGAACSSNHDCTIPWSVTHQFTTGYCGSNNRCQCSSQYWGGPRCTSQLAETSSNGTAIGGFGPPLYASILFSCIVLLLTLIVMIVYFIKRRSKLSARLNEERIRARRDELKQDLPTTVLLTPEYEYDEVELAELKPRDMIADSGL